MRESINHSFCSFLDYDLWCKDYLWYDIILYEYVNHFPIDVHWTTLRNLCKTYVICFCAVRNLILAFNKMLFFLVFCVHVIILATCTLCMWILWRACDFFCYMHAVHVIFWPNYQHWACPDSLPCWPPPRMTISLLTFIAVSVGTNTDLTVSSCWFRQTRDITTPTKTLKHNMEHN